MWCYVTFLIFDKHRICVKKRKEKNLSLMVYAQLKKEQTHCYLNILFEFYKFRLFLILNLQHVSY